MNTNTPDIINTNKPDNLVYLDIETTGLYPHKGAKIIEIAMLKINGEKEERFEQLVNPKQPIPQDCSKIHFIYDDMVKDSPVFKDIAQDVLNFIGSNIVVCHNAKFDLSFINKEVFENNGQLIQFPFIDTFILARQYFNFDSNALGNIADAVGIEVNVKHRAMADVLTMLAVSKYLFSNMFRKGISEIKPKITNFNPSVFPNTIS